MPPFEFEMTPRGWDPRGWEDLRKSLAEFYSRMPIEFVDWSGSMTHQLYPFRIFIKKFIPGSKDTRCEVFYFNTMREVATALHELLHTLYSSDNKYPTTESVKLERSGVHTEKLSNIIEDPDGSLWTPLSEWKAVVSVQVTETNF